MEEVDGVKVLVASALLRMCRAINLDVSKFIVWKSIVIEVEERPHAHGPT